MDQCINNRPIGELLYEFFVNVNADHTSHVACDAGANVRQRKIFIVKKYPFLGNFTREIIRSDGPLGFSIDPLIL